ncbi:hypothetical protein IMG5_199090 [Ichthyophthirius multifiliis]|uniref:Uncharacterized protein n=1 Tax=Ichthyophthirius multifiliis TaxID=5932 RepID=G0R5H9_ICHMU|nr:hypothetical protein IMG5_199090 [Ichthyophthirius multifiliis]EGR27276.1 hypothetical protein IMG5_199090 [Ichthyophthirius multifiliis]|eukprot:XP_004024160.1 hypothetical protein IMG5_199090 [Ichthyophthirius multifiliis]
MFLKDIMTSSYFNIKQDFYLFDNLYNFQHKQHNFSIYSNIIDISQNSSKIQKDIIKRKYPNIIVFQKCILYIYQLNKINNLKYCIINLDFNCHYHYFIMLNYHHQYIFFNKFYNHKIIFYHIYQHIIL